MSLYYIHSSTYIYTNGMYDIEISKASIGSINKNIDDISA